MPKKELRADDPETAITAVQQISRIPNDKIRYFFKTKHGYNCMLGSILILAVSPRAKMPIPQGTHLKSNSKGRLIRSRKFSEASFIALETIDTAKERRLKCQVVK